MTTATKFKRTEEQKAIKAYKGKYFVIDAKAGTGKSSTLRDIASKNATILCFGRRAADDMKAKLTNGATANTFHAYGNSLFPKGSHMDKGYLHWLIQEVVFNNNKPKGREGWELLADLKLAINWLKEQAFVPESGIQEAKRILSDERLDIGTDPDDLAPWTIQLLERIVDKHTYKGKSYHRYDLSDMAYKAFYHKWGKDSIPEFYLDEGQDVNPLRWELAKLWSSDRLGIVGDPSQAIFQFNGAMSSALLSFQKELKAELFPLTTCWRCPSSHLDLAREIVPDIRDKPNAPKGTINNFDSFDDVDIDNEKGCMVISRVNANLISLMYQLRKQTNQQIIIHSGDVVGKLSGLVGSEYESKTFINNAWMDKYETKIDKKLKYARSETGKMLIRDNDIQIRIMLEESKPGTVGEFHEVIREAFEMPDVIKPNAIHLSSTHGAKGLEHEHVVICGRSMFPHPMAKEPWEKEAEQNLLYVALTRSKDRLDIIPDHGCSIPESSSNAISKDNFDATQLFGNSRSNLK